MLKPMSGCSCRQSHVFKVDRMTAVPRPCVCDHVRVAGNFGADVLKLMLPGGMRLLVLGQRVQCGLLPALLRTALLPRQSLCLSRVEPVVIIQYHV